MYYLVHYVHSTLSQRFCSVDEKIFGDALERRNRTSQLIAQPLIAAVFPSHAAKCRMTSHSQEGR